MGISVGDLVQMGHLGCAVIAGSAGLDREICWAHVCELKDPLPWLTGGELVMTTGLAIPRHPVARGSVPDLGVHPMGAVILLAGQERRELPQAAPLAAVPSEQQRPAVSR